MARLSPAAVALRLRELAAYLRLFGESPFRARAYETGAAAVEALGARTATLFDEGRLTEVPGIGDKLAVTIGQLFESGTTPALARYEADFPRGLVLLGELPGLTAPRLRLLHETLGISDAASLEAAARAGALLTVRGFGPRTVEKLLAALARRESAPPQLLLAEARALSRRLCQQLAALPGVSRAEVAGSTRRWRELVGTVRVVAAAEAPEGALDKLIAELNLGTPERSAGRARFAWPPAARVEVEVVTPPAFAAALLRQTGPARHLDALTARAHERGQSLDDLHGEDEAAIYRALDLPFLPPELREEPEDLALAAAGERFDDLVALADVRGFVHCHTTASDGRADLPEMAAAAAARGMAYLTVTDHSPTASYAGGLLPERLQEQGREIAAYNQGHGGGLDVLHGTESDIRADGNLDYAPELLRALDIVIASIHNRFGMDEEAMTRRLVTAMAQPLFKIWGHGLGRILLHRPPITCRVEEVLDAAAAGRAAIEINGDPRRLDLEPRWLRAARQRRLPFVVSVDAHSVRDYDNLVYGVHLARRAGIRRGEVLNTRSPAAFRAAVRPAG